MFGVVSLVAGGLDARMLARGVEGAHRIARHLWRMCYALWIATMSFFLGQPAVFPEPLRHLIAVRAIPVVLISQYRIYGDKEPHWIIVSGCDQRFIYAHDPYISEAHVTTTDRVSIPILRREFELMARYGRSRLQAAIIVSKRDDAR